MHYLIKSFWHDILVTEKIPWLIFGLIEVSWVGYKKKLIQNKKLLLKLQKQNYLNFKYDHKFISNLIDKIRNNLIPSFVKKIFLFRKQ